MTKLLFSAAAASLFALGTASTASATDLNDQVELCKIEMQASADLANLSGVTIDFRSNGGGVKRKKLSFRMSSDDTWGMARCTIIGSEIQDVRYPRQFAEQIELAKATQTKVVAETEIAEEASR